MLKEWEAFFKGLKRFEKVIEGRGRISEGFGSIRGCKGFGSILVGLEAFFLRFSSVSNFWKDLEAFGETLEACSKDLEAFVKDLAAFLKDLVVFV